MAFIIRWAAAGDSQYASIADDAQRARANRLASGRGKTSRQEGVFGQVTKAIRLLAQNPRHPSLQTHEFTSKKNPYDPDGKVFEAYAQNKTPGAYRIFWCYGPGKGEITILAITPHP
jgi:hypothetical protein